MKTHSEMLCKAKNEVIIGNPIVYTDFHCKTNELYKDINLEYITHIIDSKKEKLVLT